MGYDGIKPKKTSREYEIWKNIGHILKAYGENISMEEGICYIIGAGEFDYPKLRPKESDYIIGVDGGFAYLKEMGLKPDMVLGDFDSFGQIPVHSKLIQLAPEKDDTDMMAALRQGMELGYRSFHIYGGLGGRLSHTIANLQCLVWLLKRGARGYLFYKNITITAVTNGSITFGKEKKGYLSVFTFDGEAKGVTLKNLKYPLEDAVLKTDYPIGVSNEFLGMESEVSVKEGVLLLVMEEI